MKQAVYLTFLLLVVPVGPARAGDTGTLIGTLDQPARVTAVTAIDRDKEKKYPGKVDPQTGRFTVEGLPLDAAYDLLFDLGGSLLEGVNLKVKRSDYEEEQPMTAEDVEILRKTAQSLSKFKDKIDVLTVQGNIQHAAVLLNKLRTREFVNSKPGEVIWRLELWHFERPDETWIKGQDEMFIVLHRERVQRADYDKKSITLDAGLGGLRLEEKNPKVDVGMIKVPAAEPGIRLRGANGGSANRR